jgi:hypothetical protein
VALITKQPPGLLLICLRPTPLITLDVVRPPLESITIIWDGAYSSTRKVVDVKASTTYSELETLARNHIKRAWSVQVVAPGAKIIQS